MSSDFEVPPSSRKVISSEETVTVNKVDSTDDKEGETTRRTTATKVIPSNSKAEDKMSRMTTRPKAKPKDKGGKQKVSPGRKMTRKI